MDFNSNIKEIDAVTKEVNVSVPSSVINEQKEAELKKLSQRVKLKGFRPGKAPQKLVESMYSSQMEFDVLNDLCSKTLNKVITEQSWRLVGSPKIEFKSFGGDQGLEYVATVYLYPRPEINGYESFDVEVKKHAVEDKDVDAVINRFLEERSKIEEIKDRDHAELDDVIRGELQTIVEHDACHEEHEHTADCKHTHTHESAPEPVVVKLGSGRWSVELEKQIVGLKKGETKSLDFAPKASEGSAEIKDSRTFNFKLTELFKQILPELNDELVVSLSLPEITTLADWKTKIKEDLAKEEERLCKERVQAEVVKQLSAKHDFLVPQVMIDEEIVNLVKSEYERVGEKIADEEIQAERYRDAFETVAKERIKNGVILFTIGEKEGLLANTDDVNSVLRRFAHDFKIGEDKVKRYLSDDGKLSRIRNDISLRKIMEFLESKANVTYKND